MEVIPVIKRNSLLGSAIGFTFVALVVQSLCLADDSQNLRQVVLARFEALSNVSFSVEAQLTDPPPTESELARLKLPSDFGRPVSSKSSKSFEYRRLDQNMRYNELALTNAPYDSAVFVSNGARSDYLRYYKKSNKGTVGHIDSAGRAFRPEIVCEVGLALRCFGAKQFLSLSDVSGAVFSSDSQLQFEVLHGGYRHIWELGEKGGRVERYRMLAGEFSVVEILCSEFVERDGWELPRKIVMNRFSKVREGIVASEHATLSNIRILAPDNTDQSYLLTYPAGALVLDDRSGMRLRLSEGTTLSEEFLAKSGISESSSIGFAQVGLAFLVISGVAMIVIYKRYRG